MRSVGNATFVEPLLSSSDNDACVDGGGLGTCAQVPRQRLFPGQELVPSSTISNDLAPDWNNETPLARLRKIRRSPNRVKAHFPEAPDGVLDFLAAETDDPDTAATMQDEPEILQNVHRVCSASNLEAGEEKAEGQTMVDDESSGAIYEDSLNTGNCSSPVSPSSAVLWQEGEANVNVEDAGARPQDLKSYAHIHSEHARKLDRLAARMEKRDQQERALRVGSVRKLVGHTGNVFQRLHDDHARKQERLALLSERKQIKELLHEEEMKGPPRVGPLDEVQNSVERLHEDAELRKMRQREREQEILAERESMVPRPAQLAWYEGGLSRWDLLHAHASCKEHVLEEKRLKKHMSEEKWLQECSIHAKTAPATNSKDDRGLIFERLYNDNIYKARRMDEARRKEEENEMCHRMQRSIHRCVNESLTPESTLTSCTQRLYAAGQLQARRLEEKRLQEERDQRRRPQAKLSDDVYNQNIDRYELLYCDAHRREEEKRLKRELWAKEEEHELRNRSVHLGVHQNSAQISEVFERLGSRAAGLKGTIRGAHAKFNQTQLVQDSPMYHKGDPPKIRDKRPWRLGGSPRAHD